MKTFLRVLIIGAILLILVLLSVGIVRIVPKALSSLASATVSINSLFGGSDGNASTTNQTTEPQIVPNGNGFIIVGQNATTTSPAPTQGTKQGTTATTTRSILNMLKPNFGKYAPNNYIPTPSKSGSRTGTNSGSTQPAVTCAANGTPDIAVSIIGKGTISKTTGQYIESNSFTTGDMVSIKFKIENRGTCPTGTWSLATALPSQNATDKNRSVTNIASLPAGSAVTGQANFDNPMPGNVAATFTATDTSGRDSNGGNNTAAANLAVTNTGTGTNPIIPTIGNGQPDLMIQVVQTGILTYNNQFVTTGTNTFRTGDRVAVKFNVINQGQTTTGAWNFRAELSDYPARVYENPQYEAGIPAGGKATYTIAFDNIKPGSNTITIFVDSMNQVNEFNESNNVGAVSFNVNY